MLVMNLKLKQFQEETCAWRRMLAFMLQENAVLKTRLSEVLKENGKSGKDFLMAAEQYQNEFLRKDEIINMMRHEISDLDKLLAKELYEGNHEKEIIYKQQRMRRDVQHVTSTFNELRFDFNNHLAENL